MAWTKMSTVPNPVMDSNGDVASGYVLKCYLPGTTTATSIATDSSGGTTVASMTTNAAGVWEVSGNEVVPHIDRKVKWGIFQNSTHAAANTPFAIGPFDNVEQSSSTQSDNPTPAFIETQLGSAAVSRVFTLTLFAYQVGATNTANLMVFRNGQKLTKGVTADYTETSTTTVTLTFDPNDNDSFDFIASTSVSTAVADASTVTYTPAGSGAVATDVQAKLRESVSVKDFGAVGDGVTDDTSAVGLAITAIESAGGSVFFPKGTYLCYIDIGANDITLEGEGVDSIIKTPDSSNRAAISTDDTSTGRSNITIKNLKILGNSANQTGEAHGIAGDGPCDNWLIENVWVEDSLGHGTTFRGGGSPDAATKATNIRILNCRYKDCGDATHDSIYFNKVRDSEIDGNFVTGSGRQQIAMEGSETNTTLSTRYVRITNNHIYNGTLGGIDDEADEGGDFYIAGNVIIDHSNGAGIRSLGPNGGTVITGNVIINANQGIDYQTLNTSAAVPTDAFKIISNNYIENSQAKGINSNRGPQASIINNMIIDTQGEGIHQQGDCADVRISGNQIINSAKDAVLFDEQIDRFSITDNIIRDSGNATYTTRYGINLNVASGKTGSNGIISNNLITDKRGTQYQDYAIKLARCVKVVIQGNDFSGNKLGSILYVVNTCTEVLEYGNITDGTDVSVFAQTHFPFIHNRRDVDFADADATPSVSGGDIFRTANTGATTITDFDDGRRGQQIKIIFNDANTTVDFTGSSLKGNGGVDWTPSLDDSMICFLDGDNKWHCIVSG